MKFENFQKNPSEIKPRESFEDKMKKITSLENGMLDRFIGSKIGKMAVMLSLMTALVASFEKSYAQDDSGKVSQKTEDFFDLSGKKSEGSGMNFIVGEGKSLEQFKVNPSDKVVFENKEYENIESEGSFMKEDANGNVQKRSIGEVR